MSIKEIVMFHKRRIYLEMGTVFILFYSIPFEVYKVRSKILMQLSTRFYFTSIIYNLK